MFKLLSFEVVVAEVLYPLYWFYNLIRIK